MYRKNKLNREKNEENKIKHYIWKEMIKIYELFE